MEIDIVTKEDLNRFRGQLLEDIKSLLLPRSELPKTWISSSEVRRLLKISQSSLNTLRVKEGLNASKLLGTMYYNINEINKLLEKNAVSHH